MWWVGLILVIVIALLLCFVRFTLVGESTAVVIMRFGGIVKVFMQWTGYKLDEDDNVVEIPGPVRKKLLGGLRFWIGTPFDKVHKYRLRWHSVEEKDRERVPVYHDEIKNFVMVKVDAYWRKISGVETADGQFPDVEWLVRMRAVNPRKVISKAPHDWVENALTVLEPLLVWYVRTKTLDEFISLTTKQIWRGIGKKPIIQNVLKEEWGILIEKWGIEKFAVILPPPYQEALAARSRAEMEAEAKRREAEIGAFGRAAEIMGTVIEAVVGATTMSKEKVQQEFQEDPEAFYRKHKTIIDNVMTKLSMEERAYVRIETPGAKGALGDFLRLIAGLKRMPMGKPPEAETKEEKKPPTKKRRSLEEREKRIEDMTDEELKKLTKEEIEERLKKILPK